MGISNLQRLQDAGIVRVRHSLSDDEVARIESLDYQEVDALISAKEKLGDVFIETHAKPSVDFAF